MPATPALRHDLAQLLSPMNPRGALRLGSVVGIPVYVHWSWFAVAAFEFFYREELFVSPVWHVALYLTVFVIVLLHEFGHAFACLLVKGRVDKIVLWPLGGIAHVLPPPRPGPTLISIAAGPLVNAVLLPLTAGLAFAAAIAGWAEWKTDLGKYLTLTAIVNATMLGFNLLPIYPLDGGQIVQCLLWFAFGRPTSLRVAGVLGVLGAAVLVGVAILLGGSWLLAAVGVFVGWAALAGFVQGSYLARPGREALVSSFVYLKQRQYARAEAEATRALAEMDDDKGARAIALMRRAAARIGRGRADDAVTDAVEASVLAPHPTSFFVRGAAHLAAGRAEAAVSDFSQILAREPDHAAAHYHRGAAFFLLGDYPRADDDLEEAGRLAPDLPERYGDDGEEEAKNRLLEATIAAAMLDLSVVTPPGAEALEQANRSLMAGDVDDARTLADQALRENPDLGVAYVIRGEVERLLGRFDAALADYDEALRRDPLQENALAGRAAALAALGRDADSQAGFAEALRVNPRSVVAIYQRGVALLYRDRPTEALADFRRALAVDPNQPMVLNHLALVLATSPRDDVRDGPEAVRLAARANELTEGKSPAVLDTLACAHAAAGDFAAALRWQQAALDAPGFPEREVEGAHQRLLLFADGKPYRAPL